MEATNPNTASPFSTAGGGFVFEYRVQAAFVALMLTGSPVPTQLHSSIDAIKLQRRYDKYNIDDLVVECRSSRTNLKHKLLAQVKHSINITKSDEDFSKVMSEAWGDFNNSEKFSPENDTIALITGPLSKVDIEHVRPILDWARHSENSEEFFQKVKTSGASSIKKREKLDVFKYHLGRFNGGCTLKDEDVWRFLKSFYLIGYDFDSASGSDLSQIQALLKLSIIETATPDEVWNKLINTVQDFNPDAGTMTLTTLPQDIKNYFKKDISLTTCMSIQKLAEHGNLIIKGVRTEIAGTHVRRIHYIDQIINLASKCNFIIVTGSRGSGKSAISKEYVEGYTNSEYSFCLRAEDLDQPHLDQVFTSIGIDMSLSGLSARFALIPKKYLVIESLEKLLELNNRTSFCDLLEYLKEHKDWTVIASCREYAVQQICLTYLQYQGVLYGIVKIGDFSDNEFNVVVQSQSSLKTLACHEKLNTLLRNPFVLDMAIRVLSLSAQSDVTDEGSFKKAVWQNVIRKESERAGGMPTKRAETFIQISTQRAKKMAYEVSESGYDPAVLYNLESDCLLCRNTEKGLVRPSHDVLEDWAIESYIESAYRDICDTRKFLETIGSEPAILRAFRFWLHQKINVTQGQVEIVEWCGNSLVDPNVPCYWRDEIIVTILSGCQTEYFLHSLKEQLLCDQHMLLKRICFLMRVACKTSSSDSIQGVDEETRKLMSFLIYRPSGECWPQLIKFIYQNRNEIDFELLTELPYVLDDYSNLANYVYAYQPDAAKETGLLALLLFEKEKDKYRSDLQEKLLKVILRLYPSIEKEFNELLSKDVTGKPDRDGPHYVQHLMDYMLIDFESGMLAKFAPDTVMDIARQEWLLVKEHFHNSCSISRHEVDECFGLSMRRFPDRFNPASGLKGPFLSLLRWHESKGLDFILNLCNYSAEKYAKSQLDGKIEQVDIVLNDKGIHKQYCSGRLWAGYRGITVFPDLLQSALMALENWLIAKANEENDNKLPETLQYILKHSNSVMTTAVIASIITGFPEKCGDSMWPLLRTAKFYSLDTQRRIQDTMHSNINMHRAGWQQNPLSEIYAQERDDSNSHKWRKEELEFLVCKLQFTSMREKVYEIIDNYFKNFAKKGADSESWKFRLSRTDMRDCKVIEDKENNCIRFESAIKLSPDLQEKSEVAQKQSEVFNHFTNFFLWAEKEFNRESTVGTIYHREFDTILPEIKQLIEILEKKGDEQTDYAHYAGGILKGIAILLRDYSNKLDKYDIEWCAGMLCCDVAKGMSTDEPLSMALHGKTSIEISKILPVILEVSADSEKQTIRRFIVEALTHSNADFGKSIACGIQEYLWGIDSDFAQSCLYGSIEFARLQKESGNYHYDENALSEYSQKVEKLREQILKGEISIEVNLISFDAHSSYYLLIPFLMLPARMNNEQYGDLFLKMISLIQDATAADIKVYGSDEKAFDSSQKFEFVKSLTNFLLTLPVDRQDAIIKTMSVRIHDSLDLLDNILLFYLHESERAGITERFWDVWSQIAHAFKMNLNTIMTGEEYESREAVSLLRRLFFSDFPLQNANHRKELLEIIKKGKGCILDCVKADCSHPMIYSFFARLIYLFPELLLSEGLLVLGSLSEKDKNVLAGVNTVYYLESILHRLLIVGISTNRINKKYYDVILVLLNGMIDRGSTTAFFLRDHLLTMKGV